MSTTLHLLVSRPGSAPEQLSVSFSPHHLVGELAAALAHFSAEQGPFGLAVAGGPLLDPAAPIAGSSIRHGDHLLLVDPRRPPDPPAAAAPLELRVVSGAAAGVRLPLHPGRYSLGRALQRDLRIPDPSISRSPAWIAVDERGVTLEHVEGGQHLRAGGQPVSPSCLVPLGQVFEMGGALMVVARTRSSAGEGRGAGGVAVDAGAAPSLAITLPPPPPRPRWPSIRVGRMGRLGPAGDWTEAQRAARYRRQVQQLLRHRLPGLLAEEEAARSAGAPDACELADRARLALPGLWQRRRTDPGFLRLRLGWCDVPSAIQVAEPTGADPDLVRRTVALLLPARPALHGVPLTVDLPELGALAVTGDAAETAGLLRWLVLQAACLHAPGELAIAAVLADAGEWGWLGWLPHTAPDGLESARRLVAAGGDPRPLLEELSAIGEERRGDAGGRALLVVLDGECAGAGVLLDRLADAAGDGGVFVLHVGTRAPAGAPAVVQVLTGRNQLVLSAPDGAIQQVAVPDRVGLALAAGMARDLARRHRDEDAGRAPGLPRLLEGDDGPLPVMARWAAGGARLQAAIAVDGERRVDVDLAAAPHALVTGTVEAGRSELLAAWSAALAFRHSPRRLNLVLVGGPALRDLHRLPHAVALPPAPAEDLVDGIADALLAELERRRRLLDAAGERELRHLARRDPDRAPAHLVAVLDGYDRLARLRPQVEGKVARLAELGPAAGIHLVLGIHPAAALPAPIRASAGTVVRLDPEGRGRGALSIGGVVHRRVRLADPNRVPAGPGGAIRVQGWGGCTDLSVLVQATVAAAEQLALPLDDLVWRPDLPRPAARTSRTRGGVPAPFQLRLTVESATQPPRDVAVEIDPELTVADLVRALCAELGVEGGPGAGASLRRGRVRLRPDQTIRSTRLRSGDVLVVGPRPAGPEPGPDAEPAAPERRLDGSGRIAFNRQPRPQPVPPELDVRLPPAPERGQGGWRSLVPVGTGVLMGLMLGGSTYLATGPGRPPAALLVSAGVTPAMALLAGIVPLADALRRRRRFRRAAATFRDELRRASAEIERARAAEAAYLHDSAPDPDSLAERARTLDPRLWERRPASDDWLRLRIGLRETGSGIAVHPPEAGDPALRAEARDAAGRPRPLPPVPMTVSLAEAAPLGLHGDRRRVSALARWLAVQLATLHSPEELAIAAAVPTSERPQWSWLSWLPHVHGPAGPLPGPRLVAGSAGAGDLLQRLLALIDHRRAAAGAPEPPVAVVAFLHEDAGVPRRLAGRLLAQGHRHGVHVVWLAGHREDLPGQVRSAVGLRLGGAACRPELLLVEGSRTEVGTTVDGVPVDQAMRVARALAPLRDLGAGGASAPVPDHADLLELLQPGGDLEAAIEERWAAPRERRLEATIGASAGAEFTVDLRADGPHVLLSGPASSGKSELLRTLVTSLAFHHPPWALAFLLVDHEGQGTFERCAGLPHTAAVVTDLDAGGARRVLTALRSELNRRERLLRENGVRDLATLEQMRPELAPPSLVIVVDELGRLTADRPEVVDGLRSLAQWGGRPGIHLVVATRHPAGVNADLRLSLRVTPDTPRGRVSARGGLEAAAVFQAAFTGGRSRLDRSGPAGVVVRELEFDGTAGPARRARDAGAEAGEVDLVRIGRAIAAVAARRRTGSPPAVLRELSEDAAGAFDTPVPLARLLGIPDAGALDVDALWRPRPLPERLRVPVGLTGLGQPLSLDLKEAAAGGAGPHGLVIGTSGSGKSELLRTLVTALALTHPPDVLAFVFVDFKGGAAFAGLSELPHVAGMITNLQDDLSLIDRARAAITGERNRRQERLRRAGNVDKLSEYQRRREQGEELEPLPYLLLVVDEFGELLTARPDFVDLFAMVGRVGRSLGMHLIFSSQQFEEGRLRGLEDNLGYRVALRTATAMASRTVLGVPDAFELPREPGWGYCKLGPAGAVRFRAAMVSAPAGSPRAEGAGDAPTMLDRAVAGLRDRAEPAHRVWLPPLEVGTTLDGVLGDVVRTRERGLAAPDWPHGHLRVPVGLVDKPAEQQQDPMTVDLTGHLLIVGASQAGKSTLLRTLLASAALTHTPREARFYCIDYGGGGLRSAAGLPHVGGVCGRDDPERVRRTVEEVAALVATRERLFQDLGIDSPHVMRARRDRGAPSEELADVFLVIDGWPGLRQEFGELEDVIRDVIAARGAGYGVHLVLTASRWLEVRDALRSAVGGRLELRLTDPAESAIDVRAARSVSEASGQYERRAEAQRQLNGVTPRFEKLYGRGITAGGLQFQAALPRIDGRAEVLDLQQGFEALVDAVAAAWSGPAAAPIRVLPRSVAVLELPVREPRPAGVPVALSEHDLCAVHLDPVGGDPHLMVFGDVESGKTTFLRTFLAGLLGRTTPDEAQILLVDYRRGLAGSVPPERLLVHCASETTARESLTSLAGSLARRLPGPEVPAEQLQRRSWWKSPAEVFVVVDDYDLVAPASGGPLQALFPFLPQARDVGLHLVVARSSGGVVASLNEAVLRRLRELRTPMLLLSGEPQEGALPGGHRMTPLPPGRGRLIRRREGAVFVQVATTRP